MGKTDWRQRLLNIFAVVFLAFLVTVFLSNLVVTAYFDYRAEVPEHVLYRYGFPLFAIIGAAVFAGMGLAAERRTLRPDTGRFRIWCTVLSMATGLTVVLFIAPEPVADQEAIHEIVLMFMRGDYSELLPQTGVYEGYLAAYPHQLGMIAFMELLYTASGIKSYLLVRLLNVIAVGVIVYRISGFTEKAYDEKAGRAAALLAALCFPMLLLTGFVYGDLISAALSLTAFNGFARFLRKESRWDLLRTVVAMGFAVLLRKNTMILVIAMVIVLWLARTERRTWEKLLLCALLILLPAGLFYGIDAYYAFRSGYEISDGIPALSYIAMGFQRGKLADGWFNRFNWDSYVSFGCDGVRAKQEALAALYQSFSEFRADPAYALRFLWHKFSSQWCEPTMESIFVNFPFKALLTNPAALKVIVFLERIHQLLILFLSGCWFTLKRNKTALQLLPAIAAFGGFLFHMLWEAKSRYILIYFVLLIPYAAAGLRLLADRREQRKEKRAL
ncbi:MAG: glycosyltransferase family 39 protein [Oscillospiraceae bacterium]|nr:glycosyltransferase family 39 protein [Oscillospiraceae bacterium]